MTGDLVRDGVQVHENAGAVLDFWFALPLERQFAKDDALDREIARRFGAMRAEVVRTGAASWRDDPDTLLAAIILIDQFSRNLFRDSAEALANDPLATSLTLLAIERGWEPRYAPEERVFLYMPLMHAEDLPLQSLCIEKFEAEGVEEHVRYARDHAEVIRRFGRFPSRYAALGRETRPDEREWLTTHEGW